MVTNLNKARLQLQGNPSFKACRNCSFRAPDANSMHGVT